MVTETPSVYPSKSAINDFVLCDCCRTYYAELIFCCENFHKDLELGSTSFSNNNHEDCLFHHREDSLHLQTSEITLFDDEEIEVQSEQLYMSNETIKTDEDNKEVMAMGDNTPLAASDAPSIVDESFRDGYSVNAELASFLSRPVLTRTYTWTEGSTILQTFNPWVDYFNNPIITRKLQNYAFLNCNLKVRILINASPFYYGYAFACYGPMTSGPAFDPGYIFNSYNTAGAFMALSCRQRIDIYPSKNQGGEMTLPFIFPLNWLRIGKLSDFEAMGGIAIVSTDPLFNANSVVGSNVTIQVFVWAEDVMVSGPTSELPLQTDEYRKVGKISSVATKIADVSGMAAGALPPLLKPYALATQIGATSLASIASLFGYTNVPVVDDVTGFKNLPFHGLASSEISTPQEKLTIDPKNELTIDNRLAGGKGDDELSIQYLCSKKNVFSLVNWTSTDAAGTIINTINVSPSLSCSAAGAYTKSSAQPCYHPPMTLVAKNFRYWRGTMVYRFKFVCSQYHRGRIGIIWDPAHVTTTDYNYTTNYSRVVDLAEESEIIIKVPFMQPTSYLKVGFNPVSANIPIGTATTATFNEEVHNGKIILKVLTNQTSPVASADVLVYVETSMEDADFAGPTDPQIDNYGSYLQIQTDEKQIIVQESNIAGIDIKPPQHLHSVYMGEKIGSMRQLMRRRAFYRSITGPTNTTSTQFVWTPNIARRPAYTGFDSSNSTTVAVKVLTGPATSGFNFVNELVSNMFAPCFVGERGSYNYDINLSTPRNSGIDSITCSRSYVTTSFANETTSYSTTSTGSSQKQNTLLFGYQGVGKQGSALTNQKTQAGLSVQAPFYSQYRFASTNPLVRRAGNAFDDTIYDTMMMTVSSPAIGTIADPRNELSNTNINLYCGIGTDFQLLCFVNVPAIWYYTTRPVSS